MQYIVYTENKRRKVIEEKFEDIKVVIRSRTDKHTMDKRKKNTKRQKLSGKIQHRKQKTEQHELQYNRG